MKWQQGTIGDLVSLQRGHDLPDVQRKAGDIPVIGSAGITGYHNVARSKGPGVTLGRSGASIGKVTYVDRDFWPHNACLYVTDFRGNSPKFVSYLLKTVPLAQLNSGAAQPSLNRNFVYGVRISFPDRDQQDRLAEVLSSYDDLIENNRRRIELLEEAARQLYKEWFVRFRFPGHEHVKIVDGIPHGWTNVPAGDFIATHIGGGWGQDESIGNETEPSYVIRGTDMPSLEDGDISSIGLRYHKPSSLKTRWLEEGDIVFEVSGGSTTQPVARSLFVTNEMLSNFPDRVICASFCKRFTFKAISESAYFFFKIREDRENGKILVYQKESASALKNFNFSAFLQSYMITVPPDHLLGAFYDHVELILRNKALLVSQISQLARARDLLLPKLMSGEIAA